MEKGALVLLVSGSIVLLMVWQVQGQRMGPSSPTYHSHACFGTNGLHQTINFLSCRNHTKYPRICIYLVKYGGKNPNENPELNCPPMGVSRDVPEGCCTSSRRDCVVTVPDDVTMEIREKCAAQSMTRCSLQADQITHRDFLQCTATHATSTYRYIRYVCIPDEDVYAKTRECYVPRPTRPPARTWPTDASLPSTQQPTDTQKPTLTRYTPTTKHSTSQIKNVSTHVSQTSKSSSTSTRVLVSIDTTAVPPTPTLGDSIPGYTYMSHDEKIIMGVSISVVGVILLVVGLVGARAYVWRFSIKRKNRWLENNLNKDRLNNKNESRANRNLDNVDGEGNIIPEGEAMYKEINELTSTPHNPNNVVYGQDIPLSTVKKDNNVFEIKSIGNNQYQEVGLSQNNPLFKSNALAPPGYTIADPRIRGEKRRRNSKHRKSRKTRNHDSENATLNKVAMFVKKYLREVDGKETHDKLKSKKRRRRNRSAELASRRKKDSHKRKSEDDRVRVKPWDFIPGSRSNKRSGEDDADVHVRKSSLKKKYNNYENTAPMWDNFRIRRESHGSPDENDSARSSSLGSSDEEVKCRFPIRQRSIMKRREKSKSSESEYVDESSSDSDQSGARNVGVRFHRKLTYINSENKSRRKNKRNHEDKSRSKTMTEYDTKQRYRDLDNEAYERDRKDSMDLHFTKQGSTRRRKDVDHRDRQKRRRDESPRKRDYDEVAANTRTNGLARHSSFNLPKHHAPKRKVRSTVVKSHPKRRSKVKKRRVKREHEYVNDSDSEYTDYGSPS